MGQDGFHLDLVLEDIHPVVLVASTTRSPLQHNCPIHGREKTRGGNLLQLSERKQGSVLRKVLWDFCILPSPLVDSYPTLLLIVVRVKEPHKHPPLADVRKYGCGRAPAGMP